MLRDMDRLVSFHLWCSCKRPWPLILPPSTVRCMNVQALSLKADDLSHYRFKFTSLRSIFVRSTSLERSNGSSDDRHPIAHTWVVELQMQPTAISLLNLLVVIERLGWPKKPRQSQMAYEFPTTRMHPNTVLPNFRLEIAVAICGLKWCVYSYHTDNLTSTQGETASSVSQYLLLQ